MIAILVIRLTKRYKYSCGIVKMEGLLVCMEIANAAF